MRQDSAPQKSLHLRHHEGRQGGRLGYGVDVREERLPALRRPTSAARASLWLTLAFGGSTAVLSVPKLRDISKSDLPVARSERSGQARIEPGRNYKPGILGALLTGTW